MPLSHIPLEDIKEADILALVESQKDKDRESKSIEYKRELPQADYESKKEFLADVSSFANASGGDIIFGIEEDAGRPVAVRGLGAIDADAEILRLESMILDAIEPRIPGLETRAISLQTNEVVLILRVPRSWVLPHVVTLQKHWRFYSRNSVGKYMLDVGELRTLFALSESSAEKLRNFRAERLSMIVARETPVQLQEFPKTVLHIIPLQAFEPGVGFDVASLEEREAQDIRFLFSLAPMNDSGWDSRHNFDGFLTYAGRKSGLASTYLQIFRSGILEAVDADLLRPWENRKRIPSVNFEKELLEALPKFTSIQKALGVQPPFFVMLSLLGVKGYTMAVSARYRRHDDHVIEKDALLVPENIIESYDYEYATVMRPLFDAIWNAAGWARSMNYDGEGQWKPRS